MRGAESPQPDPTLVARVMTEGLPDDLAIVMATLEALPPDVVEPALAAIMQSVIAP